MKNNYINRTEDLAITISSIGEIIVGLIVTFIGILIFVNGADNITRISAIPIFICGIAVFIRGVTELMRILSLIKMNKNLENGNAININDVQMTHEKLNKATTFSHKLYIIGFLVFWFGFLIFFDYLAIKDWNNGGSTLFLFSFIFWVAGIYLLMREL